MVGVLAEADAGIGAQRVVGQAGGARRIEPSDESRSARKADTTTSAEEVIACPTRAIAKIIAVFGSSPARSRSR